MTHIINRYTRFFVPLLFLTFLFVFSSCGGGKEKKGHEKERVTVAVEVPPQESHLVSDLILGRKIFETKKCSFCHSIFKKKDKIGPRLSTEKFYGTFFDIYSLLWNHLPAMAVQMRKAGVPIPQFSTPELNSIISFLYMLPYISRPGNPEKGADLLSEKGCLECHRIAGKGKKNGISLDSISSYTSMVVLVQKMWNHGPVMFSQMAATRTPIPEFRENEMMDLFAALSKTAKEGRRKITLAIGDSSFGKKLFKEKGCNKCHPLYGKGIKGAPDLSKSLAQYPVGVLGGIIWNHASKMQKKFKDLGIPWPYFTEKEMADLFIFLYSLNYQDPPGDAKNGEALFEEKKCAECHLSEKRRAKNLKNRFVYFSSAQFATRLWNHFPRMEKEMVTSGLPWPELTGKDLRDIFAYLKQ